MPTDPHEAEPPPETTEGGSPRVSPLWMAGIVAIAVVMAGAALLLSRSINDFTNPSTSEEFIAGLPSEWNCDPYDPAGAAGPVFMAKCLIGGVEVDVVWGRDASRAEIAEASNRKGVCSYYKGHLNAFVAPPPPYLKFEAGEQYSQAQVNDVKEAFSGWTKSDFCP